MYKCKDCGCVFDDPKRWRESRGEFWGVSAYETMIGCPECYSGDFEECDESDQNDKEEKEE